MAWLKGSVMCCCWIPPAVASLPVAPPHSSFPRNAVGRSCSVHPLCPALLLFLLPPLKVCPSCSFPSFLCYSLTTLCPSSNHPLLSIPFLVSSAPSLQVNNRHLLHSFHTVIDQQTCGKPSSCLILSFLQLTLPVASSATSTTSSSGTVNASWTLCSMVGPLPVLPRVWMTD